MEVSSSLYFSLPWLESFDSQDLGTFLCTMGSWKVTEHRGEIGLCLTSPTRKVTFVDVEIKHAAWSPNAGFVDYPHGGIFASHCVTSPGRRKVTSITAIAR